MNRRHAVLAAGLAVAAWLAFFGDKSPTNDVAEPVARATTQRLPIAPVPARAAAKADTGPTILALQPREALVGTALGEKAPASLFNSHSWAPPPPPPPPPPKPVPPPPPAAPPLPFTYIGKKLEGGSWEVYLARGDQTVIINAQSVIDGTYRVESIRPPQLVLTYLPLNQQQTLTIGGTD